jgi:hypothetical protein
MRDSILTPELRECSICGVGLSGSAIRIVHSARKPAHDLSCVTDAAKAPVFHQQHWVPGALAQLDERPQRHRRRRDRHCRPEFLPRPVINAAEGL